MHQSTLAFLVYTVSLHRKKIIFKVKESSERPWREKTEKLLSTVKRAKVTPTFEKGKKEDLGN